MRTEIEQKVLDRVLPDEKERAEVAQMGKRLVECATRISGVPTMMTGSVSRGTFVKGDKDIDIFMQFPQDMPLEEMKTKGLAAAYAVVAEFKGTAEEKYAEHPYLNADLEGFDVDLVPCYMVNSTAEMKCAVDRTPFHARYLIPRISDLREDVVLLKQFCKGGGVYGSDLLTGGFSGYLCELLILNYGGFENFMRAASKYRYGEVVDIENHYPDKKEARKLFSEPLIVIDPTDKRRNVAAALTRTRFSEFMELARDYCAHPSERYFIADKPTFISEEDFRKTLAGRGTSMMAISLKTPGFVEDVIVPQLRKTMESIYAQLIAAEFLVHRCEVAMKNDHCLIIFELLVDKLPEIIVRTGPPVWNHENADKFVEKYLHQSEFAGPWIFEDRYYTEVRRKYVTAISLLEDRKMILSGSLGKHVRASMEEHYDVLIGPEIWSGEFADFLSAYFLRSSHAVRKLRRIAAED